MTAADLSTPSPRRRGAKIVATLGPASSQPEMIHALVAAGLDVARLNFSHGDHASLKELVRFVREAQEAAGRPIAILGDLQGPKIRIGPLSEPVQLTPGSPHPPHHRSRTRSPPRRRHRLRLPRACR